MTTLYVLAAILMLGIMVTVHEAGHFFAARLTGIPVKEFAIGFGPKLLSWKSKKYETQFFLRLIPAGGYCMFYGEDDTQGKEVNDPRAIGHYAVWKRFITVFMGPAMNFLLALVVASALFMAVGEDIGGDYGYAVVQSVGENTPASQAGLRKGDVLLSVTGAPYDTLHQVVGIEGEGYGSLRDYGVIYREIPLRETKQRWWDAVLAESQRYELEAWMTTEKYRLLCLAYAKARPKKGSLKEEN